MSSEIKKNLSIDYRLLLALYVLVLPSILILVLVDIFYLEGILRKQYLPKNPNAWAFWSIIFVNPHIVASFLSFADKEYLQFYKKRLAVPTLCILVGVYFGSALLGNAIFFLIYAFYSMYHVLVQQIGIGLMMTGQKPNHHYHIFKWTSVIAGFLIYVLVYQSHNLTRLLNQNGLAVALVNLNYVIAFLIFLSWHSAYQLKKGSQTIVGSFYIYANSLMVTLCFLMFLLNYSVFVNLIPRVLHDVTAYIVYIVHDRNRNDVQKKNWVYQALGFTKIPPMLLCPVVSIVVAYYCMNTGPNHFTYTLFYSVIFFHYYSEGIIWKRNGLHRKSVAFVK